jgi:hypothetical protein
VKEPPEEGRQAPCKGRTAARQEASACVWRRSDVHYKTALALARRRDTIYVESIQPANMSRRPEPKPDGHDGYEHHGAKRTASLNKTASIRARDKSARQERATRARDALHPTPAEDGWVALGQVVSLGVS